MKLREALDREAAPSTLPSGVIARALVESDEETGRLLRELLKSAESAESVAARLTAGGYACSPTTVRTYRRAASRESWLWN